MTTQPEQILENDLVKQLTGLKYIYVDIHNEEGILANLKSQLEARSIGERIIAKMKMFVEVFIRGVAA